MTLCEHMLLYLGTFAGTAFWFWYLLREAERYKGKAKPRWYEKEIFKDE